MSDNEINGSIAEECGYTFTALREWKDPQGRTGSIPRYTTDLNAMHEAEKHLGYDQCLTYKKVLNKVCGFPTHPVFASARQRAEAFLRTVGKWKG